VFRPRGSDEAWRVGAGIGASVLDVAAAWHSGLLTGDAARAGARCAAPSLNGVMALGSGVASALRTALSALLRVDTPEGGRARKLRGALLHDQRSVDVALPAVVGNYTDFYASVHHATNVGTMLRPENPLLPNYKWLPVGYHGRASSIVVSGAPIRRPRGQTKPQGADRPEYGPTQRLDYEVEVGFFVGAASALGETVSMAEAEDHLFGACLVNDWSARDIQAWEYQPLGPFLAKNFATTISPWVVTWGALAPFRSPRAARTPGDPAPLPHLGSAENETNGALDMTVEAYLSTARMRQERVDPVRLSRGRVADLYWTPAQLLAHHTSNGCNLLPGDLMASGTVSGPEKQSRGCLLELTWGGTQPLRLPTGEERRFLEDGDEVILRGSCARDGFARIGFGECRGTILPAN
jgi:fumarylacetoacetase